MTEDGRRRRRRQRPKPAPETTSISPPTSVSSAEELSLDETVVDERLSMDRTRECPVPKPGGRVGKILGFRESAGDSQQPRRARIPVETRGRDSKIRDGNEGSGKEGKRIHEDEARPGG